MLQKSSYQSILDLIKEKPKHFSRMIQAAPDLKHWVIANSLISSNRFVEMIRSAVNQETNVCDRGNRKKFKSIAEGYGFCGPSGICECARESVSKSVSKTKQLATHEENVAATLKRQQTTLIKYGVINVGQTKSARANHQAYYENLSRKSKPNTSTPYQKLNKKYQEQFFIRFITPEDAYLGVSNQKYYEFACTVCENQFSDYIDNGHIPKCKACNPYTPSYTSNQETQVFAYIKTLTDKQVLQSNKSVINPYELDIIVPDLKIAVEYCGLYWHSEANKADKLYHKRKMDLCNQAGYRLITIFEDEWMCKQQVVKDRLSAIFSQSNRIPARKCSVAVISSNDAKAFCEQHHIQGYAVNSMAYGCFLKDELVAVMTFGQPRYSTKHQYELIRFCSKGTVVGGASKLLAAFVKDYRPSNMISYCDMRWGTGNLYRALGFDLVNQTVNPSYSYTDFVHRYHRSNYMKKTLVAEGGDINKTENQLAKDRKLYRIWDCGQTSWTRQWPA
jgi:hypothetical protein